MYVVYSSQPTQEVTTITPTPEIAAALFVLVLIGIAIDLLYVEPRNRNR